MPIGFNYQNDEFIVEGYAIHDSWKATWPQTVAHAWHFENLIKEKKEKINYDQLKDLIDTKLGNAKLGDIKKVIDSTINKISKEIPANNDGMKEHPLNIAGAKNRTELESGFRKLEHEFGNSYGRGGIETSLNTIFDTLDLKYIKLFCLYHLYNFTFGDNNLNDTNYDLNKNEKVLQADDIKFANDFVWYKKLLCHRSEMVLDALMEEGFIVDAMQNPPIDFEKNLSTRIIVRKPEQEYTVLQKTNEPRYGTTTERVERSAFEINKAASNINIRKFRGSRMNGWKDQKGLGHVLVLTLPPAPEKPDEYGLAVTDYESGGHIFCFTCT